MKLPAWLIVGLCFFVLAGVLTIAGRFSEKSQVYAGGSISLAPDLASKAETLRNLFIVVFDQESAAPMPYGALRVQLNDAPQGTFHHFILTRENLSVMAGKQAPDLSTLRIKAPLTSSTFIGQDSQGDLYGEVKDIPMGKEGVEIVIDKAQE